MSPRSSHLLVLLQSLGNRGRALVCAERTVLGTHGEQADTVPAAQVGQGSENEHVQNYRLRPALQRRGGGGGGRGWRGGVIFLCQTPAMGTQRWAERGTESWVVRTNRDRLRTPCDSTARETLNPEIRVGAPRPWERSLAHRAAAPPTDDRPRPPAAARTPLTPPPDYGPAPHRSPKPT